MSKVNNNSIKAVTLKVPKTMDIKAAQTLLSWYDKLQVYNPDVLPYCTELLRTLDTPDVSNKKSRVK